MMTAALQEINFPATEHQPSTRAENVQRFGKPGHQMPVRRAGQRVFRNAGHPRGIHIDTRL